MADGDTGDSIIMEEEIDPNYVPGDDEVIEYAKWLGMELDKDQDLFWIAREGLMAPLPKNWKPCKTKDTEDIYYFNFLTGESSWDHPCDGYYKRLYEEEKKKKEILLKESADEKKAKAKQDVEILLGKNENKKSKKKKSNTSSVSDLGTSDSTIPKSLNTLGPPVLGGLKTGKPLPGIANKLTNSLDSSLSGGLAPLGGVSNSSSVPALTKKAALPSPNVLSAPSNQKSKSQPSLDSDQKSKSKKTIPSATATATAASKKHYDQSDDSDGDGGDGDDDDVLNISEVKDIDSDSDDSVRIEIKQVPQETTKSKINNSSKAGSRLKSVLTNSEDLSVPSAKTITDHDRSSSAKMVSQSTDSDSIRDSNDSLGPIHDPNFQTPVKAKQKNQKMVLNNSFEDDVRGRGSDATGGASGGGGGGWEEQEYRLQQQRTQLQLERKQLEIDQKQFEYDRKLFETEKLQFENEKKMFLKQKERLEQERMNQSEGIPTTTNTASPQSPTKVSSTNEKDEEKYLKILKDYEDLRRENISLQVEIEKGKKTLETEKNLRAAASREISEREKSLSQDLELEKKNAMDLLTTKQSLLTENDNLHRKIQSLESDLNALRSSSQSSSLPVCSGHLEKIEALEKEIREYQRKMTQYESTQSDSQQSNTSLRDKLQSITNELSELQSQYQTLQSDYRTKKRDLEDAYDEAAKYRREMEALRRQDCDLQDELVRMRQGAQRAQELQFLLDSERQTTQRLKTDYETMKLELEKIGGGGGGGGGLTSPSFPVLSTSNTTTSSPQQHQQQQQQQLQEELENKKQQLSNLQNQYDSLELRLKENIKQLESNHRIRMEELENQHYKRLDDLKVSHRTEYERLESLNNENQSKARRYELELKEKLLDLEAYEAKYLDLKGKNKDLYDQIHELEKKVLELNYQQKGEIKNIHDRNQHDLSRLQEEIQVYHHEKLQWKDEKNVLERSVEKLKDELKKKEQEMETFIEKLKDSEQIHEEKLSKNEEKLRNQTSERDEKKLHEQASLIHRLQEQVEAYQGREQQLYLEIEKKLKEEKYQHGIKDRKIEELEEELLAIQSEVEERTRLKGQETGGAGGGLMQMKLKNLESSIEELTQEKEEALNSILQLQNEKKRLKSDFDTLSFQSKIMKQDLDSSTQRIESFEKEIQQLMNEKSQLQSTNSHLNSEMNQLNTTMRVIQSEKEGLNQRILILQKENQRYSEESRQYLAAKSLQEHKIMELQHQLDSERARALEMSDRVGVGVGAGAGAGPTLLSTRSVDSLTTADGLGLGSGSSQLLQELQTLRYTLQRNESELSKNQYALSDARAVNDDLRSQLSRTKLELSQRTAERDQYQSEISSLQRQIQQKDEEIQFLKKNQSYGRSIPEYHSGTGSQVPVDGRWTQIIAGQQEQISSLQSHRLEIEKTMAQQTNIVQRLELKLKEAEDTIQNHLEATKQQQQRNVKSSIEPQSPIRTKRNLEKEHNSKRYQPTPKPSTARSRLRWNDGYHDSEGSGGENRYEEEDETSRFGDLTYEEREVSDEEEEILPTRPSSKSRYRPNMNSKMNQQWVKPSSNSSLQVVSILKDVLINLMNKDQHLEVPPGKKVARKYDDPSEWKMKLAREKHVLKELKKALKLENSYVRETSDRLSYQRELWKEKREAIIRKGGSKDAIRAEGQELNEQTNQLNELMQQIKKTQLWISEREKKLFKWEILMNERFSSNRDDYDMITPPSSSNERETLARHIEKMKNLELELDQDLTLLGSDIHPYSREPPKWTDIGSTGASIPQSQPSMEQRTSSYPQSSNTSAPPSHLNPSQQSSGIEMRLKNNTKYNPQAVKWYANERNKMMNIADEHVSWLDNLRKEINEFSQTQSHDPTATATTTGIAGGVERLSSYGAQERKRIDSAPSSSQAAAAPVGYDRDTKTLPLPPSGVYRV